MLVLQRLIKFNKGTLELQAFITFCSVLFSRVCFTPPEKSEMFIGRSTIQSTLAPRML